jgi:acetyl esterase/lipase
MRLIASVVLTLSIVCLPFTGIAHADELPRQINVWPGKAPGTPENPPEEKWTKQHVTNVSIPTLTVYRPAKDKDTGVVIIVCPGGGYRALMMDYEGEDMARWFNTIGITGVVLKYRVPAPEGTPRHLPALQDAQRTISFVRANAKEWNIDPTRIGICGFSAGGHLACAASTNYEKRAYDAIDDIDKVSCRPDFQIPIYPGGMLEKTADGKNTDKLSDTIHVTKDTPPCFLAMANDDRGGSENAIIYYLALKHAGVKTDLHIYTLGGHGFGIKPTTNPVATWPMRCEEWMKSVGILKAK